MSKAGLGELMTGSEVREYLQIAPRTLQTLIKRGQLKGAFKIGTRHNSEWRIPRASVEEYLARQMEAASESDWD